MTRALIGLAVTAALAAGCGMRPLPPVPPGVTAGEAIDTVMRRSSEISDFSGWGAAKVKSGGSLRSANLSIRWLRSGRFRIVATGPGGFEFATAASDGDSATAYIPSLDGYFRTGVSDGGLSIFTHRLDIGIDRIFALAAGVMAPPDSFRVRDARLHSAGRSAELAVEGGGVEYRYLLAGPDLRVTEHRLLSGGRTIWTLKRSGFTVESGILFPRNIAIETETGTIEFTFRSVRLNPGLSEADVAFTVPDGVERLRLPSGAR